MDDVTDEAEKHSSKIGSIMGKIGGFIAKTAVAAVTAAGTALVSLTKNALSAAGELEQNMGGAEQVFQNYSDHMVEYAETAYKNMGLSASDYLATANKMGALLQGSGFDIVESAQMSADVMQRAADVASIMGIDVSSAMEAVAGAAKGNFTMINKSVCYDGDIIVSVGELYQRCA